MRLGMIELRRIAVGLLSAGGTLVLAACYGPVRHPVGPVSGTVLDAAGPVPGARVCVKVKDRPEEPGPCVESDVKGAFTVPRFQSKYGALEVCVTVKAATAEAKPKETCVPLENTNADKLVIDLSKNRP